MGFRDVPCWASTKPARCVARIHNIKVFSYISLRYHAPKPDRHRCMCFVSSLENTQGACNVLRNNPPRIHGIPTSWLHSTAVAQAFGFMNRDSERAAIHRKHAINTRLQTTSRMRQCRASHAEGLRHFVVMTIRQSYEQAERRNETRRMNPELLKSYTRRARGPSTYGRRLRHPTPQGAYPMRPYPTPTPGAHSRTSSTSPPSSQVMTLSYIPRPPTPMDPRADNPRKLPLPKKPRPQNPPHPPTTALLSKPANMCA